MRRVLIIALALASIYLPLPRGSMAVESKECKNRTLKDGSVVTACAGAISSSTESNGSGRSGRRARPEIDLVKAVSSVNGQPCTILATPTSQQGRRELNIESFLGAVDRFLPDAVLPDDPFMTWWSRHVASLGGCPGADVEQVATGFVLTAPLPRPQPHIAPGFALTGKRGYLETRASERAELTVPTPLGPLAIVATRTDYLVDWGDGSGEDQGPFPYAGQPWPEGRITHTYTDTGRYDVVVVERWEASWKLGDEGGTVAGLRSAPATIEDFEVRQLQVINR